MKAPRSPRAPTPDLTRRALKYVRRRHASEDGTIGFYADGDVQTTSAGVRVVHLHQEYRGIPLHGGVVAVHFQPNGRVRLVGDVWRVPRGFPVVPHISAPEAVLAAARHVAGHLREQDPDREITVSNRAPEQVGRFAHPSRPTVLRKPPFRDPVTARLVLVGSRARLAWEIHLRMPKAGGEWDALIAADRPNELTVLRAWRTVAHAAQGFVYEINPDTERTPLPFPCLRTYYPSLGDRPIPPGHEIWATDGQTRGNNVVCLEENSKRSYSGVVSNAELVFKPTDEHGMDQRLLNAFYLTNALHDFFLLLGFDEAAGNFQGRNFSGQGEDDDRLIVRVFNEELPGFASMRSRRDGNSPELTLGPVGDRHTALDAEVVIHEYVHGVTNRTIGGRDHHDPLRGKQQSEAMGEGYSDYFALSIANFRRRKAGVLESRVYGAWVSRNTATGLRRRHAYGPAFPDTYDTLRATATLPAHHAGQVWCEALLRLNETLGGNDADLGDSLGWQLVMDSLKLIKAGEQAPTFLDGRNAILAAFDAAVSAGTLPAGTPARDTIVGVFTRLGMGPAASSPQARYSDIVADLGV